MLTYLEIAFPQGFCGYARCIGFPDCSRNANKATHVCPCGYYNHPEKECTCSSQMAQRYLNKVSGPLLDRIDLHVEVTPVAYTGLSSNQSSEPSAAIRARVIKARNIQAERFKGQGGIYCNAVMSSKLLKQICVLDQPSAALFKTAMEKLNLSARAYDRILKVSRILPTWQPPTL